MLKKVKVQLETEVSDIPKFCSLNLAQAEQQLEATYNKICNIRADLNEANLEDVKVCLAEIERIRTSMGKADGMLADIFGILIGFVELTEKLEQKAEDKKEET